MSYTVKLADLAKMSAEDEEQELRRLTDAAKAPANGRKAAVHARIRGFELRYEMSSEEMQRRLADRTMRETAEVAEWLFLLGTLRDWVVH